MEEEKRYTVGKPLEEWEGDSSQTLTFIVTEECNLRCKYCYVTHKQGGKVMSLDVAKKFIELALHIPTERESVILDFIGGEPLLEAGLIEKICDFFKKRAFELNHPWYWKYRINVGTNGVNYSDAAVQRLIEKNRGKISVAITLDGTKEKHDMQRVFPDGSGSYDVIMKNIPKWLSQFPGSTKVTFSSDDLPLLKESIIHLWNLGITEVAANVVFENAWKEGDDKIFEEQMKALADYIIENNLYDRYLCTLFEENLGHPYSEEELCNTSCGAGKMLAVNYEGNIYPCVRYYDHSLNHRKGYIIGNVEEGLFYNRMRVFGLVMAKHQCDKECRECEVAGGCSYCQGFCYDEADTDTNFQRAKYICNMHKARVRANNYYFARLKNIKGIGKEQSIPMKKTMLFLLGDDFVDFCSYGNQSVSSRKMDKSTLEKGLKFAGENFYHPVFLHSVSEDTNFEPEILKDYEITHIRPAAQYERFYPEDADSIPVFTLDSLKYDAGEKTNVILTVKQNEISDLSGAVSELLNRYDRVNLKISNQNTAFYFKEYKEQLQKIKDEIVRIYREEGILKEVNAITDILFSEHHEICGAGDTLLAYAPDGKFYVCPAFYAEKKEAAGNLKDGILLKNRHLYTQEYAPLCSCCDAYQCENCIFINKMNTWEVNVSPDFQCIKAHVERDIACELYEELKTEIDFPNRIRKTAYIDPYSAAESRGKSLGFYKEKGREM